MSCTAPWRTPAVRWLQAAGLRDEQLACFVGNTMLQHAPGVRDDNHGAGDGDGIRPGAMLFLHANLPKWQLKAR